MTYLEATKYLLDDRKLTKETIKENNVAFCSKQGWLYASTTYPKDFTQLQFQYFDCLVFPIYDLYGTDIGIMARRMHDSKSKYVNSATSDLFSKGRHLYGLNKSWPYILAANQAIVVEGIFDFLQLYQSGIRNVVSMMGTNLSDTQTALLSRFTDNLVILPDPDKAGDRAGSKIRKASSKFVKCSFVQLPDKLDPDEMVIRSGPDALRNHITTNV